MKYKLINQTTNENTICDKVIINGFNYYVSDNYIDSLKPDDEYFTIVENPRRIVKYSKHIQSKDVVVIATNDFYMRIIPQVIDIVKTTAISYLDGRFSLDPNTLQTFEKLHTETYTSGYNEALKTYPFSREDMIDFGKFCQQDIVSAKPVKTFEQLLQIWKEQQPKIVYYETN